MLPTPGDMAAALTSMFGPSEHRGEVEELLADEDHDMESLADGLEQLLDLPETAEPLPDHGVVVCRGEASMIRLAAAVAGPSWLLEIGAGWTVLVPTKGGETDAKSWPGLRQAGRDGRIGR